MMKCCTKKEAIELAEKNMASKVSQRLEFDPITFQRYKHKSIVPKKKKTRLRL